ncbi:hypothetical protein Tco_0554576 [Tanacetum coccineum]
MGEEPAKKPKRAKKPAKKSTTVPTAGVAIKDAPSKSVPKKKTPAKVDRGKGMDLLSNVALLEAAQIKKTLKKSKLETHKLHAIGSDDGVGSLPKFLDEQEDKTTGDSDDDDSNEVTKDDDEYDVESDAADDREASDSEKMNSDKDENLNLNQNDDEEEEKEKEYVRNPDRFEFNDDDEKYEELYKDVNVRLIDTEHKEQGKEDEDMTDAGRDDTQQTKYEQVKDDEHVTLTAVHDTQKTEVVSMMNVKVRHEEPSTQTPPLLNIPVTVIPETLTDAGSTISLTIPPITPLQQQSAPTPTPAPTTAKTTTSVLALPDFSSLFDAQISTRLEDSIKKSFRSYTTEFEKKAKDERKRYIDLVEKSVKEIIKDEVKSQLPQILPKEISDFATPVIQSTINESLENILLDKLEKSKSYRASEQHKDLYDALVKSYLLIKDLFDSYGKAYYLKRGCEDKGKDEDSPAGSDHRLKKRKTSKDSGQEEELVFETADIEMPQDQGDDLGNTEDQTNVKEASKHDWFKKPERPPTPNRDWNAGKQIDFRPPQTWISKIAKAGKLPITFDKLMNTPIDFSEYVLNNIKIENLTQEYLVGPAFNLLKGTRKSRVELEYHLEECYKAITDKLDWTKPEGHEYLFDLSKPLPLIEDQGRQVVPANYFFNNNLEYLKGGSLSSKYTTSTTKTKAAKYDTIEGIEDMVPSLWSLRKSKHDVFFTKRIIAVTHVKFMKKYDYGYLDEIIVRTEDQSLHKFIEGDFPRLNLYDIEDMLLLLVQKKLSNLERDDIFDLNIAMRMFTRRVVIIKQVENLQLGFESYQK